MGEGDDAVVALTLEAISTVDVQIEGDVGSTGFAVSLDSACPGEGRSLACEPPQDLGVLGARRVAPGTYYLVIRRPIGFPDTIATVQVNVDHPLAACSDGVDNDEDALIDADDPGCESALDPDETDPGAPPACNDGLDNDDDGLTDFPADPDCFAAGDPSEAKRCPEGVPTIEVGPEGGVFNVDLSAGASLGAASCTANDRWVAIAVTVDELSEIVVSAADPNFDGVAIVARSECAGTAERSCVVPFGDPSVRLPRAVAGTHYFLVGRRSEFSSIVETDVTVTVTSLVRQCNDGEDNDADGLLDLLDPGCADDMDDDETDPETPPECSDGLDNDMDGQTDYPEDPACQAAGGASETLSCDLVELVAILEDEGGRVETDIIGLPDLYNGAACGGGGRGGENVIGLVLTRASDVRATMVEGDYDSLLFVRTDCDDVAAEIACNDDAIGVLSQVNLPGLAAGTYYFFVDSFGAGGGTGALEIVVSPL